MDLWNMKSPAVLNGSSFRDATHLTGRLDVVARVRLASVR